MSTATHTAPLVVHIVHRFDYGGLENGIVNLINTMPAERCRHAVVAMTEATDFAKRIRSPDVEVIPLGKKPGKDPAAYLRLWRLLRQLRPSVVHTRNIGTMDCVAIAWAAGIPVRIHGEHGWDTHDPDGINPKYRRLRKLFTPLVSAIITVSEDLRRWLLEVVKLPPQKITAICNGVDTEKFRPAQGSTDSCMPAGFCAETTVIAGAVLRFEAIKDPLNLVNAFIEARSVLAGQDADLRLVMLGDGALMEAARQRVDEAGLAEQVWMPGMREDVAELMRHFDIFVLPSRREGISNTILEAMACGLPVVATETGGNVQLVADGTTGTLVEPEDSSELATALVRYASDSALRLKHGHAARQRAESTYSLTAMAAAYLDIYEQQLNRAGS